MATFSGGGRTREPGEMFNRDLLGATSLDDAGYVLAYNVESSVTKVDKCTATEVPAAVNYRSTRDPHDMNEPQTIFKTGTQLEGVGIPVFREGWAKLKVANNNAVINRGDAIKVAASGGGKIDKYTPTVITNGTNTASDTETRFDELSRLVGHCEEEQVAIGNTSSPGQDKCLVKLSIRAIGLIT